MKNIKYNIRKSKTVAQKRTKPKHKSFILTDLSFEARHKFVILSAFIAIILIVISGSKAGEVNTKPEQIVDEPIEIEALRDVYEEEKDISLDGVSLRYSVFENATYGYRFAYPVGFTYDWQGMSVLLTPKSGKGSIAASISGNSPSIESNTAGLDEQSTEVINSAAQFIRQTFEFTTPISGNREDVVDRFGTNPSTDKTF